jgi:hypothetical protein
MRVSWKLEKSTPKQPRCCRRKNRACCSSLNICNATCDDEHEITKMERNSLQWTYLTNVREIKMTKPAGAGANAQDERDDETKNVCTQSSERRLPVNTSSTS